MSGLSTRKMRWVHSAVDPRVQDSAVVEERRVQQVAAPKCHPLSPLGHRWMRGGRCTPTWSPTAEGLVVAMARVCLPAVGEQSTCCCLHFGYLKEMIDLLNETNGKFQRQKWN